MREDEFLAALRRLPLHPGASGLTDDTAKLAGLTITTDTIVEGVHFLPDDPPGDVAWKLVAVSLSDLAAKGAIPEGVLLNYPLGDDSWDESFLVGLAGALTTLSCPLLGGDTVLLPTGAPRVLTLTAIGRDAPGPPRSGAKAGDALWVTGNIGNAGAGLRIARGEAGPRALLAAYRRPTPRLAEGRKLALVVNAMMDISDGLLIDASRMAAASGLAVTVDLAALPLSADYLAFAGADRDAHVAAATAGDDYELLFALPKEKEPPVGAFRVGRFTAGSGITLMWQGRPVPLPATLGFRH
ncbi:MAG: thiamine-phosphate kinase [Sphingomonas sp.]|uniref:thiamine-phosphate kinase n=1 Tax=Sphingomonas sp. TaxID=28214 RepID=UPI001ACABE84|nr:thiamine-phosphate kinase [Sphingomonas sp.]MBN8815467.1 thiamine-phosphate kinase [Sphingomonas sp.]